MMMFILACKRLILQLLKIVFVNTKIIAIKSPVTKINGIVLSLSSILNLISFLLNIFYLKVDIPKATSKLNKGAAQQPVIAISANPFLAIEVLAIKSPMEFPQARTVNASKVEGRPVSNPKIQSKSIKIFADIHIQNVLTIKEKDYKTNKKC